MRPGLDFPGIAIAKEAIVAYNPFRKSLGVVPLLCDWESIRRIREIGWKNSAPETVPYYFHGACPVSNNRQRATAVVIAE